MKELLKRKTATIKKFKASAKDKLKVATIMDEFSFLCYSPECSLLQLTPDNCIAELEAFKPDLLFIESAANGKDSLWADKIKFKTKFKELSKIITWCNKKHIPTAFWNKEDPTEFDVFIKIAECFDFIFTVDANCISDYKKHVEHDRVYLLPFAAQPEMYNPVEKLSRKDAFCFVGSYYRNFQERCNNFKTFIDALSPQIKIDIYDRYFNSTLTNYLFPEEYSSLIIGNLSVVDVIDVYKKYKYAINMNSVKDSPTMMSRRVFELIASNILVFSNYSNSAKLFFGDLIVATDDNVSLMKEFDCRSRNEELQSKIKLHALRKIMTEHTYHNRFSYVTEKIFGTLQVEKGSLILIIAFAKDTAELGQIFLNFSQQEYAQKQMIIVCEFAYFYPIQLKDIKILSLNEASLIKVSDFPQASFIGIMSHHCYYGPSYLVDLNLAIKYKKNLNAVTKANKFSFDGTQQLVNTNQKTYCFERVAYLNKSIVKREVFDRFNLIDFQEMDYFIDYSETQMILRIDGYNYCSEVYQNILNKAQIDEINAKLDFDCGYSLESIYSSTTQKIKNKADHDLYTDIAKLEQIYFTNF